MPNLTTTALQSDSSRSGTKKRCRSADEEGEIHLTPEVLAQMSRSERKKFREKKRRSDGKLPTFLVVAFCGVALLAAAIEYEPKPASVAICTVILIISCSHSWFAVNKGFDDLVDLLVTIDPVVKAEHEDRVRRGATEEHLLSRVELIGRTVDVLRRVHKENEERKLIIQQLLQNKPAGPPANPTPAGKVSIRFGLARSVSCTAVLCMYEANSLNSHNDYHSRQSSPLPRTRSSALVRLSLDSYQVLGKTQRFLVL